MEPFEDKAFQVHLGDESGELSATISAIGRWIPEQPVIGDEQLEYFPEVELESITFFVGACKMFDADLLEYKKRGQLKPLLSFLENEFRDQTGHLL